MKFIFLFLSFLFLKFTVQAQTFFHTDSLMESTYGIGFKDMVECNMDKNIYTTSLLSQNLMTTYKNNFVKSTIAKFTPTGQFIKQINYIKSDTIVVINHIVNKTNSILAIGSKNINLHSNQLRLAWYDTSLNLINEKLYTIPTLDSSLLEIAHFDSLYNTYYCFINSINNSNGVNNNAFVLKIDKTTLDSVELLRMDTLFFDKFLSVFLYDKTFKVLFNKKPA